MKGDVTLRLTCLLPERLIQRATASGARFTAVERPDDRTLLIRCDAASAGILLGLCVRFSIPAKVLRRRGGSALSRFARRRRTLPAGLLVAAALCWLFLGRIWWVDVAFTGEAASLGDREAMLSALSGAGIRPGMARSIDTARLSGALQSGAGNYSYVGARVQGVRLLVEAVPELPAPAVYDVEAARDLVSDRDGIVIRAVVRSGALCVKPGDAVRRGQLLIRGEEQSAKEETRPIAALGEVIVRAWYSGGAALPKAEDRMEETGTCSTGSRLKLLGLEWPIAQARDFAQQRTLTEYLPVGGLFLPLELERTEHRELRTQRVPVDPEALRRRVAALALADAAAQLQRYGPAAYEIADSWVEYSDSGDVLRAQAVFEIHADAAVTREALLQGG